MRLFILLKNIILYIKNINKLITSSDTLKDGYIVFPNGFKVCCGSVSSRRSGSTITLPVTFEKGTSIVLPIYYTGAILATNFASTDSVRGNSFTLHAYDTNANAISTRLDLTATYIVLGY